MIKYLCYSLFLISTSLLASERVITPSIINEDQATLQSSSNISLLQNNALELPDNYQINPFTLLNSRSTIVLSKQSIKLPLAPDVKLLLSQQTGIYPQKENDRSLLFFEDYITNSGEKLVSNIDVSLQLGKVTTSVGVLNGLDRTKNPPRIYAQIGFSFIDSPEYTVVGIAKINHFGLEFGQFNNTIFTYDDDIYYAVSPQSITNTTLSIMGAYRVSPQLTILGSLSTTALGNEVGDNQMFEFDSTQNQALVGASYSF